MKGALSRNEHLREARCRLVKTWVVPDVSAAPPFNPAASPAPDAGSRRVIVSVILFSANRFGWLKDGRISMREGVADQALKTSGGDASQ